MTDLRDALHDLAREPSAPLDVETLWDRRRSRRRRRLTAIGGAAVLVAAAGAGVISLLSQRVDVILTPFEPPSAAPEPVPADWIDVRIGYAVLSIPPDWQTISDEDNPRAYWFACGRIEQPVLRISSGPVYGASCPLDVPPVELPYPYSTRDARPDPPSVVALDPSDVSFWWSETFEAATAVEINGVQGYLAAGEQGEELLLLPDLLLELKAHAGDDPGVAAQVLRSVRTAPDAPPTSDRRPLLVSDDSGVSWLHGAERDLVARAEPGRRAGDPELAPGSTQARFVFAFTSSLPPEDLYAPDLRPGQVHITTVHDGVPVLVWSATAHPTWGGQVDGVAVSGGPVWSPDGQYIAFADAVDRRAVIRVVGWSGEPGTAPPDVAADIAGLGLPGPMEPLLHQLSTWEWDESGADGAKSGRLVFNLGSPGSGLWLPVDRLPDGQVQLPDPLLRRPEGS